ncbi:hypothetical protein C1I93_03840 [Micromonospora endophytica]|uniref:Uncharacterized protein n=1 Tax=Micromonospora endophytica TaxID=515350 RepID=A0A2W2DH44_9ACTN|nr:hypothetical protein C1I93_03840 [Micromonospora endophytica]RIW47107.1 hypothetical protein D3H59_10690 [Micromonospora endophytica]
MPRRHRGASLKVGDAWASGSVVSYLVGSDGQEPRVMLHVSCRIGGPWAELPLPQIRQLVEQLRSLLTQAVPQGGEHGGD